MYPATLSSSFAGFLLVTARLGVNAQQSAFPETPLISKHFAYPTGIPYQSDTDTDLARGIQTGYNECNTTTEGPDSFCQTAFVNALDDFCFWAPPKPNSSIADSEGEEVAWCTKPGRGTRLIPPNALQGVQFMRTDAYVQVVGFIDQMKINMMSDDPGGELDPHGADFRGNPLGGLVYSTAWSTSNDSYTQVIEWHNFMGGGRFCFKVCDPSNEDAPRFCEHKYDRIGCEYNAPNDAQNGTFESCLGDVQDYPGIYTSDGAVVTYQQPRASLGVVDSMPYQPKVPQSSSCTQYSSAQVFSALGTITSATSASSTSPTESVTGPTASGNSPTTGAARNGGGGATMIAASTAGGGAISTSGAEVLRAGLLSSLLGVAVAVMFLS
ncbi:hypothetical protein DFH06DRAFT_1103249 [Mycena polygramma]|nr:hypothetical protein DFH06DRAFT_1103249 [Mycena polygramma]